jgi:hypothetical protein
LAIESQLVVLGFSPHPSPLPSGEREQVTMSEQQVDLDTLYKAREKSRKLVEAIQKQFEEVEANPPKDLPPEKLAMGRIAMMNSIASAKRSLAALEDAIKIAEEELT